MAIGSPQWMYASGEAYEIDQSLRFNDDDSAYLSWTPSSAGNRRTFTWSGWVKRSKIGGQQTIFLAYGADNNLGYNPLIFTTGNQLALGGWSANWLVSTALFRDPSAWLHIVLAVDTTDGTADNRIKLYVNGTQLTDFATRNNPSQNDDFAINNTVEHNIGSRDAFDSSDYTDGYLAEVNFIDGQQLTPADFGETGDYGEWKPIEYSGTYGNNGFYLPFKQDYTVEGFSTVTYNGNGTAGHYIGGTGFKPDLTWIKGRDNDSGHSLVDSVRGVGKSLASDSTAAEDNSINSYLKTFENDGFTLGTDSIVNYSDGRRYVAWNWDMGGSNATNTTGDITSTVRANPTYGQSIVSWSGTGSGSSPTIGHGLSSAPDCIIVKRRSSANGAWPFLHEFDTTKYLQFQDVDAASTGATVFDNTAPTSSVFTVNATNAVVNASGHTYIAYCWHSVTGYSKFGSYSGTGSNVSVTTGFAPAFTIIKRTDTTENWFIFDNTREPDGVVDLRLTVDGSDAEATVTTGLTYTSTGFTVTSTNGAFNASGGTYIYMAFADKREYAYWLDQSGNNNDWTSNNLTESDISVDSPTNNFATFNPLLNFASSSDTTYSEGNLKHYSAAANKIGKSTIPIPSSGKWYFESILTQNGGGSPLVGLAVLDGSSLSGSTRAISYRSNGDIGYNDGSHTNATGYATWGVGDVIALSVDVDSGTIKFYKNNTLIATFTNFNTIFNVPAFAAIQTNGTSGNSFIINFGQDSSFAGNKVAQGNQDSNDIGDFYYTPPTGFLALCTKNLPDVAVVPSEHFNTVLWTGTGSAISVSGVGFQPDWVWGKNRAEAWNHYLFDAVRGTGKLLQSNLTNAETNNDVWGYLSAFNSDGFSLSAGSSGIDQVNDNSDAYVAWNWKANGSGSSGSNLTGVGSCTVSANVDSGFSIAEWTSTQGGPVSYGHGLSQTPEMIITKSVTDTDYWSVGHKDLGWTKALNLNDTRAAVTSSSYWNDTAPTSTIVTLGGGVNNNKRFICYAFHSVDGYSKVGSYTGNGIADGTFVYTGFRPAFVMVKSTTSAHDWVILDSVRSDYNPADEYVIANSSQAESSNLYNMTDFTANGFKLRDTQNGMNGSNTYIYIAFAETPFKNSNAR